MYDRKGMLLTGYSRVALGSSTHDYGLTALNLFIPFSSSSDGLLGLRMEAGSLEADFALSALYRLGRWFSVYGDVGGTAGSIAYHIQDTSDSTAAVPSADGEVLLYGIKNHLGMVVESKYVDLALEQGIAIYGHGTAPSFGLRITFKNGFKK